MSTAATTIPTRVEVHYTLDRGPLRKRSVTIPVSVDFLDKLDTELGILHMMGLAADQLVDRGQVMISDILLLGSPGDSESAAA